MFKKFRDGVNSAVESITQRDLTKKALEKPLYELQLALIANNVAVPIAEKITKEVEQELVKTKVGRLSSKKKLTYDALRKSVMKILNAPKDKIDLLEIIRENKANGEPTILAIFGPNGAGKTTTIAKLTQFLINKKLTVVIGAGDTFRAGAIDQISKHCQRLGVKIIKQDYGSDPAAVIYDTIQHARSKKVDVVIADTAGRLDIQYPANVKFMRMPCTGKVDIRYILEAFEQGADGVYIVGIKKDKIPLLLLINHSLE